MTRPEDEEEDVGSLPPGGKAMQRRKQFLEQRGLPTEDEPNDETEEGDSTEGGKEGADEAQDQESQSDESSEGNGG